MTLNTNPADEAVRHDTPRFRMIPADRPEVPGKAPATGREEGCGWHINPPDHALVGLG
jgi:hypothetical protein